MSSDCLYDETLSWNGAIVEKMDNGDIVPSIIGSFKTHCLQIDQHTSLDVRIYHNAQIQNAIQLHLAVTELKQVDGLLVKNYRPKLMKIGAIDDIKPIKLKNCTRKST